MTAAAMTRLLASLLLLLLALPAHAARPYRGGVVASLYPQATEAGLQMLDRGGNAVDAAVAMAFAAAVAGPYHTGLAGGGFALVARQGKEPLALDFREVAPAAASRDMFLRDGKPVPGLSIDGGLAVAVPNAVNGYLALLEKAGSLPRSVVLAPAIRLARDGLVVTPKYRQMATGRLECLRGDSEASRIFLRPGNDGRPEVPALGTRLRQPELARTLECIATSGAAAMRSGPVAHSIAQTVREAGGVLAAEDLAKVQPRWRSPLWGSYRGHRIAPPSLRRAGAASSSSRRWARWSGCGPRPSSAAPRPTFTSTSRRSAARTPTAPASSPIPTRPRSRPRACSPPDTSRLSPPASTLPARPPPPCSSPRARRVPPLLLPRS